MSGERLYDEDEIEEIFRRASEVRDASSRDGGGGIGGGLTLPELQEIGEEVGISRERVAGAASTLDAPSGSGAVAAAGGARKLRRLGVPVGVERTVTLDRALTDLEWERLVARLRRTFRAQGRVEVMGGLRQWQNGNLQVSVEPTEDGYQLRLHTYKGSLRPMLSVTFATLFAAAFLVVVSLVAGTPINMLGPAFLGFMGVGVGVVTLGALPAWAATRARQMDEIGEAVRESTALPPPRGA